MPAVLSRVPTTRFTHWAVAELGRQLDQGVFPEVFDGGLIAPSSAAVTPFMGAENDYAGLEPPPEGSEAPAPSPSPRPSQSPPDWPPSDATPIERRDFRALYEDQLTKVRTAYPNTKSWPDPDGIWLLSESSVTPELDRAALFLTAISWSARSARAWAYWRESVFTVRWIGPRHTNFPDGSVCAFDPSDLTWTFGDPIVPLLDLYTVWALRHLHLELLQRWPGPQSVHHPYERRVEFRPGENCGCGSNRHYDCCCKTSDASGRKVGQAVNYLTHTRGGLRNPPSNLAPVLLSIATPPPIASLRW
jgi:hypothetical protein